MHWQTLTHRCENVVLSWMDLLIESIDLVTCRCTLKLCFSMSSLRRLTLASVLLLLLLLLQQQAAVVRASCVWNEALQPSSLPQPPSAVPCELQGEWLVTADEYKSPALDTDCELKTPAGDPKRVWFGPQRVVTQGPECPTAAQVKESKPPSHESCNLKPFPPNLHPIGSSATRHLRTPW